MNRTTLARRFAPLVALAAVQLLIIAVVPSKAPTTSIAAANGTGGVYGGGTAVDDSVDSGGEAVATVPGETEGGTVAGPTSGPASATGSAGRTTTGGRPKAADVKPGDVTHCANGRQFDARIDYQAPPCLPKFGGDNGGATYMGVTKDTIKIVDYYDRGNDAVNEILKAAGSYVSVDQLQAYDKAAAKFINDHFETYGRRVEIKIVQGTCQSIPPDVPCLRKEFDDIIAAEKPFAIKWDTSLCSACYDEISQKKVINVGGYQFREGFGKGHRPYHWDTFMTGTNMMRHFAQWYCANLAGKPAKWGGTQNPVGEVNGKPRLLGVIATNDPENQGAVTELAGFLKEDCKVDINATYFYAQDITTAETQRVAGVTAMRRGKAGESTTVLCFCDEVAPQFLFEEEQQQNYYPENVIIGSQSMDLDRVGQSYGPDDGGPSLACPSPQVGCEYDLVVGLAQQPQPQDKEGGDVGARVWKAGGGQGAPPFVSVSRTWDHLSILAHLIQAAGPNLTPANAEAGIFKEPARGGNNPAQPLRFFAPGNYGWTQDMVTVYWSKSKPSPFNGKPGRYFTVGPRVKTGEWKPIAAIDGIPADPNAR
ncbi:MAG TPA: hypothetical protein VM030_10610 [Acidimicrobiales bacterium]|nr:hypothetical protein [Acidimicrobiales bacterium]